jgi:hypothetical protein
MIVLPFYTFFRPAITHCIKTIILEMVNSMGFGFGFAPFFMHFASKHAYHGGWRGIHGG